MSDLNPGHYCIWVTIDASEPFDALDGRPGDYASGSGYGTEVALESGRLQTLDFRFYRWMRLTSPIDTSELVMLEGQPPNTYRTLASPFLVSWQEIPEAVRYGVNVVVCPLSGCDDERAPIFSTVTLETSVELDLPPSQPSEKYWMNVGAFGRTSQGIGEAWVVGTTGAQGGFPFRISMPVPMPTPTPAPTPTPLPTPTAPSVITKTADSDDGVCDSDCSLREAISVAVSGDTISIPAGTYTLTVGSEVTINKNLTLIGAGQASTVIQATADGSVRSRVFKVTGGNVSIANVTIKNGKPPRGDGSGGGILVSNGSLTLSNSTVTANAATLNGGGIYNLFGTLTLNGSSLVGNQAANLGGGLGSQTASATLNNSTVTGNTTTFGGGGILSVDSNTLIITDSVISNNTSQWDGGGIFSLASSLNLNNTNVTGNATRAPFNVGCGSCAGGGIRIEGGTAILTDSTITGNSAGNEGGGLAASLGADITLINTTITGNSAAMDPDCSYVAEQPDSGC